MGIERISVEAGFGLGAVGPLAISVWDAEPRVTQAKQAVKLLERLAREHEQILLLAVIGEDCALPSEYVRKELSAGLVAIGTPIVTVANVIEGRGFRAAALRGVLTGLGIVVKHDYPREVFDNVPKAANYLERESRFAASAIDITRGVAALRTREESGE